MNKNKGYTLIEALISIIIISMLGWVMFFSMTSMKATARADKIIKDLYAWKSAVHVWYFEHVNDVVPGGTDVGKINFLSGDKNVKKEFKTDDPSSEFPGLKEAIAKYVQVVSKSELDKFHLRNRNKSQMWFVAYDISKLDITIIDYVKQKLATRATLNGENILFQMSGNKGSGKVLENSPYVNGDWVLMKVMEFDPNKGR